MYGVALADGIEFVLFKMVATRTKMIVHNESENDCPWSLIMLQSTVGSGLGPRSNQSEVLISWPDRIPLISRDNTGSVIG